MNEKLKKEIDTAFGLISTLLVKGDAVDTVAEKAALRRAYALVSDSEETATKEESNDG